MQSLLVSMQFEFFLTGQEDLERFLMHKCWPELWEETNGFFFCVCVCFMDKLFCTVKKKSVLPPPPCSWDSLMLCQELRVLALTDSLRWSRPTWPAPHSDTSLTQSSSGGSLQFLSNLTWSPLSNYEIHPVDSLSKALHRFSIMALGSLA